jgi:hypothetical protein
MAAANAGAKVLVLEKQAEASHVPSTRMSSGIWHSPDKDGDRAAIKAYALAMFSGENVPGKLEGEIDHALANELADIWAKEVPSVIDFLKGLDPDFKPVRGAGTHFPTFPGAEQSKYRAYISSYTGKVDMAVPTLKNAKAERPRARPSSPASRPASMPARSRLPTRRRPRSSSPTAAAR